jgi:hypothetical protein
LISIFIIFSPDRHESLNYTLSCLRDMPEYESCQKTLVVDGKIDKIPFDWEALQVPRINNKFCWGRMWDAGVYSAKYDKILYLDSDRLLPKKTLTLINKYLKNDMFLFTSRHFNMQDFISLEECKKILSYEKIEEMLLEYSYLTNLRYEVRHKQPFHGAGKNVMSGSTAFTKNTYLKLGGVDQWYCGHGAFADSDFHMQASISGCVFYDLGLIELHLPHNKIGDKQEVLKSQELYKMGLDNFIYYCNKWNISNFILESYASNAGITKPAIYIAKKMKEILG